MRNLGSGSHRCVLKEGREPRLLGRAARHVLQFRAHPSDAQSTPAMAAGVTSRLWEMSVIVDVLEAWEAKGERPAAVA